MVDFNCGCFQPLGMSAVRSHFLTVGAGLSEPRYASVIVLTMHSLRCVRSRCSCSGPQELTCEAGGTFPQLPIQSKSRCGACAPSQLPHTAPPPTPQHPAGGASRSAEQVRTETHRKVSLDRSV